MSDASARLLAFLLAPRTLFVSAWILAVGIGIGRIINAHLCFQEKDPPGDPKRRLDGNNGHIAIDFGGQWMMGRMLARGYGRELYSLPRQWEVAAQAYPRECEAPASDTRDSERLIRHFMGRTDRRWGETAGSIGLMLSPTGPWQTSATAIATEPAWEKQRLQELAHPKKGDGIGGPLYPPIQAFVMLPFATGDHPQAAYFVMQYVQVFLCFFAGLGVRSMSRGRIWWPIAAAIILAYPGSRGTIDLGQNSALTMTLLIWGWVWIVRERPTVGGLIWGMLAFKPVWALSFFFVLLLMRQWRAALAMVGTSLAVIAATLPFVGLHSWFHWLSIGQEAARIYSLDVNWISLSRDVLGLPRRLLLDFSKDRDDRESLVALIASWALWAFVIEMTLRAYFLTARRKPPLSGPFPAMIILAAWLCTYHFMYYDALVSAFGVFVLLAGSGPFFRVRKDHLENADSATTSRPGRKYELVNAFVLGVLAVMILHENITQPLKLEWTWVAGERTSQRRLTDGTTEIAPRLIIGTSDKYPWDTLLVMALWLWCWGKVLAGRRDPPSDLTATQPIEGGPDVRSAH